MHYVLRPLAEKINRIYWALEQGCSFRNSLNWLVSTSTLLPLPPSVKMVFFQSFTCSYLFIFEFFCIWEQYVVSVLLKKEAGQLYLKGCLVLTCLQKHLEGERRMSFNTSLFGFWKIPEPSMALQSIDLVTIPLVLMIPNFWDNEVMLKDAHEAKFTMYTA